MKWYASHDIYFYIDSNTLEYCQSELVITIIIIWHYLFFLSF